MYKSLILLEGALMIAILSGCYETETFPLNNGALVESPSALSFGKDSTGALTFEVEVLQNNEGDVSSVTIFKTLTTGAGSSQEAAVGSFQTFPIAFSASIAEMLQGVTVGGNAIGAGDLVAGDFVSLRYEITMSDGQVLKPLPTTTVTFTD